MPGKSFNIFFRKYLPGVTGDCDLPVLSYLRSLGKVISTNDSEIHYHIKEQKESCNSIFMLFTPSCWLGNDPLISLLNNGLIINLKCMASRIVLIPIFEYWNIFQYSWFVFQYSFFNIHNYISILKKHEFWKII